MTLLFVDNFDSFTYNIVALIKNFSIEIEVITNNQLPLQADYDYLVLGPGPGTPKEAGNCQKILSTYVGKLPILGICLGHQIIADYFGAKVIQSNYPTHGKSSPISHTKKQLFCGLSDPLTVMRYHSLVVDPITLPSCLEALAFTDKGELMAFCHKEHPIFCVQFHPESVGSEEGERLIANFLHSKVTA